MGYFFHVFSLKAISFFFYKAGEVESYRVERLKEQELRLKTILRLARVGQVATHL